jgi:oligopeptide/dipeptide ABC transporter ATP-binding protein
VSSSLLEIRELSVTFDTEDGPVSAVSKVSLDVAPGEIIGIVGESGCGKTTVATAVMGLLPANAQVEGEILFRGSNLLELRESERRKLRGEEIAMVFQDPLSSLDPSFSVGSQVAETIQVHRGVGRRAAREHALGLLREVGIPSADLRFGDPPHRFSGGMRQRVVIAASIANEPSLLLADEPTTALDVTIQAQILSLLKDMAARHETTILLIAHDLGVVAELCDRVGVMYAGQLVELGPVARIFENPLHPYTKALLAAIPSIERAPGTLQLIPGQVPNLAAVLPGCRFAPRCAYRMPECELTPDLGLESPGHHVACWLHPNASIASESGAER